MQDFRLAFRALRSTPVVSIVAVVSLALSIGANTAIFSVVYALALRSLPVANPQHLAMVSMISAGSYRPQFSFTTFESIRRYSDFIHGALAFTDCCGKSIAAIGGDVQAVDRQYVSGDFFTTLGVRAARGRLITVADSMPTAPQGPVVVVSHSFWQARLAGASDVVGARMTIDRIPFTIVGVTPPDFFGVEVGRTFDVAIPVYLAPRLSRTPIDEDTEWLNVVVRLKPGTSLSAGATALRAVQPQIRASSLPKESPGPEFLQDALTLEPIAKGTSALRGRFERPLVVIFAVTAFVLLIACANIGNLMLARSFARRHELSVRVALGASRWRLARPLLCESTCIAVMGAALGIGLASIASRVLVGQLSTSRTPILLTVSLDPSVLAFAVATTTLTVILVGLAQAGRATRVAPYDALKDQSRGGLGDSRTALSSGLVVVQAMLCLTLLVAAALFGQTFARLARVSLGFDRDQVLLVTVNASAVPAAERNAFFRRLVREAGAVPGVAGAGVSMNPPLVGTIVGDLVVSARGTPPGPDAERISQLDVITPGWLAAYGTKIRSGRDFVEHDAPGAPPVMLVNEAFVRRLFPDRDIVGTALDVAFRMPSGDFSLGARTIVGVVENAVYRSVRQQPRPMLYLPMAQLTDPILQTTCYLGVRSLSGSPALLARTVGDALKAANPEIALSFQPLARLVDESLLEDRLMALLSGAFGALGLILSALGVYGVVAYTIVLRRREIAMRLALGATRARILTLMLTRVLFLLATGAIIGAGASVWAFKYVASLLYDLQPGDPATLGSSIAILAAVGVFAAGIPAMRASRFDPAALLRDG